MSIADEMIDAYLEHLRRLGCTDATLDRRAEVLHRLDRELPYGAGQVSVEDLRTWLYRDKWQPNTMHTYYTALRSFYRWATDPRDQWLDADPTEDLEPARPAEGVARPVTDEQLRKVLTGAAEPFRLWALIAAYQGLRCIEISRLDREHITKRQLFVVKGKGNRPRVHDTDETVWAAVKDLPPGPVARLRNGERATPYDVSARASKYFRRELGLPGVTMHRFRHWLGVTVQREYHDIVVTKRVLGHRALSSTQIYTDATDEQQRAARATLPRLAG